MAKTAAIEGLYVFYYSVPADDYEYIDTYKVGLTWNGHPGEVLHKMINRVKDKWPSAQAIIVKNQDWESCEVIKFK